MARGNALDNAPRHYFLCKLASGPVADGALFGLFTGQRNQLTGLFWSESSRAVRGGGDQLSVR
jgi:hypothetical protein